MSDYNDLGAALAVIEEGRFNSQELDQRIRDMYYPASRVTENEPFAECDGYVSLSDHPFDYACKINATLDALNGVTTSENAIAAILANGVKLDLSQPDV